MFNRCQGTGHLDLVKLMDKIYHHGEAGKGDCVKLTGNQITFLWHKGPFSSDVDQGQQPVRVGYKEELPGKVLEGSQA